MWPLNMRDLPPPLPLRVAMVWNLPGSTSCRVYLVATGLQELGEEVGQV